MGFAQRGEGPATVPLPDLVMLPVMRPTSPLLLAALLLGCRPSAPTCTTDCPTDVAEVSTPTPACESESCRTCTNASECSTGICHESGRCEAPVCATDDACPNDEICDGGQCLPTQSAEASTCGVAVLAFAFDSAKLSPSNQVRLAEATPCLLEQLAGGVLEIAAHGDALGSEDYQRTLAQRRVACIHAFLLGRGLAEDRLRKIDELRGTARSATLAISAADP
jgi:peptidoglycan-associated lipoprotein